MSEDEKENEQPDKILKIVKAILDFNKEIQEQSLGLKILTPNQMLSRLPITLVQINAGNNSEKLKNEIRQVLYSLFRLKKTYKTNLYSALLRGGEMIVSSQAAGRGGGGLLYHDELSVFSQNASPWILQILPAAPSYIFLTFS